MTTIAWDGRTLAGDTYGTLGPTIMRVVPKIRRLSNGGLIGASGTFTISAQWMKWMEHGGDRPTIIADGDHIAGIEIKPNGEIWHHERNGSFQIAGNHHAIGSGSGFALGALFMGADAKTAVAAAAQYDPYTGGEITLLELNEAMLMAAE